MNVRVTLVAAARASTLLAERFDDDRPPDGEGWRALESAAPELVPLAAVELRYCSPGPRSRATGQALGYAPLAQVALREWDMGRWRGLTLAEVAAREPGAVERWLADPHAAPHGGESLLAFIARIGGWLDSRPAEDGGAIVAVAEPSAVRAALVYALRAAPQTYWSVDVRPLSTVTLTGSAGHWHLSLQARA
ncbi:MULTISPECIES: histidine phosphatase family protein [Streptomyces]|uniref:histidine phosphatase family protein n=1 Tax=Streptomyces TaxID=1883 RepID=UPI0016779537|nr:MULTISPECIES: histidine phosphatase family protein [Streptomyces]MBD3578318.1 histidine phosphatase family protein [Streptomyces sp. KD18]GGT17406.1 phosphoglycerate mutase [Streptomyces toxytricini]